MTRAGSRSESAIEESASAQQAASLYRCKVHHARPSGPAYRFSYNAYYMLVDIDQLETATAPLRWLSINRFNLLSFRAEDHGSHGEQPLREWTDQLLADFGVDLQGGRIRLLCLPRVLGHVFNPLSVYYCEHADGSLRSIICEVHNTFGEQHCYVLHRDGAPMDYDQPSYKAKCFHVSPLFERRGQYRFDISQPGPRFSIGIQLMAQSTDDEARSSADDVLLKTSLAGRQLPMTDGNLLKLFFRLPIVTVKIVAAIHWQALKIWLRGGRFVKQPEQLMPPRS